MRSLKPWAIALSAILGAPAVTWAQDPSWGWGMHPMWGVWGIGMMLGMLLFWALVVTGIVLGIRWLVSHGSEPRTDRALAILRERYARGEINKEEFEARRRDLEAA